MKERIYSIDFLRAVSILGVIIIHALSYRLNSPVNFFFWDKLQFVVVGFVFCSGYVLAVRYRNENWSLASLLKWYKKRLLRLLIPYYWFVAAYVVLFMLFPHVFPEISKPVPFFLSSVFLTGGINENWLPLLFVELTILFPLIILLKRNKLLLGIFVGFSLAVTGLFTITTFPYDLYRWVMWIPWSLVLCAGIFLSTLKGKKFYLSIILASVIVFTGVYILYMHSGKTVVIRDNKYPPNFYFLTYGMVGTLVVFLASSVFQNSIFKKAMFFLSDNSYAIFFVHVLILRFIFFSIR